MQYLLSVFSTEGESIPSEEDIQQMYKDVDVFNEEVKAKGSWVFAGGLHPIESSTTVNFKNGEVITTDGPFAETKEYLGGFWIIEAENLDEALAWAAKGSEACQSPVEVRPFQAV